LILGGTAQLVLDDRLSYDLHAGHEVDIAAGRLHAMMAGQDGVKYAFACPLDDAVELELV
jgi:hypothetical protein